MSDVRGSGQTNGSRAERMEGFVALKRSLGYDYGGNQVRMCARMCDFLDGKSMDEAAFGEWAAEREGEARTTRGKGVHLRNDFARYVPRTGGDAAVVDMKVPYDTGLTPYIYTDDEVSRILAAADAGTSLGEGAYEPDEMMPVFLRLLYSTGLRFCEAARLTWGDIDGQRAHIRRGKNGRPRLVMMSPSMAAVMEACRQRRGNGRDPDGLVFCGKGGGSLQNQPVNRWHRATLDAAGVRTEAGKHPRLHDCRHGFALRVLAMMDDSGVDVYVALPLPSRCMGHCGVEETQHYLRLTEKGRERVIGRMGSHAPGVVPGIGGDGGEWRERIAGRGPRRRALRLVPDRMQGGLAQHRALLPRRRRAVPRVRLGLVGDGRREPAHGACRPRCRGGPPLPS